MDATLMLQLMREGAPNSELLLAKDRDDLIKIAERHNIHVPKLTPEAKSQEPEATQTVDAPDPESAYGGLAGSPALSRARAWRYQYMVNGISPVSPNSAAAEGSSTGPGVGSPTGPGGGWPTGQEHMTAEATEAMMMAAAAAATETAPPSDMALFEGTYEGAQNELGQREGVGTCTYSNGSTYHGEWKANVQEGRGMVRYADGSVFVGSFSKGVKNGSGTYAYNDGRVEVARYVNGTNDRGEGAMWSPHRHSAWRIMRDGEEVEEISLAEAASVAGRVGEPVPERGWREAQLAKGA
uniref:MORN repeat-containing protein 5 n=1 Tax=Haptolina brevifila TaxID=156173 RepID=A0A7S2BQF4_9EUKA|mmetsp:Transcript_15519/g.31152  ORF Transcript_15519/g.31152 Transcript_15519/m.31152 type:complete len:296 (+) Transcript_15519:96-983(+)|eukprot:CAMPEP_0174721764 /NCGR_PEP_ID=MMETSP1094-20130205/37117_1 /TAXON_ID=156173 /ORGANISM="Chrysochromulina brevifilum, Strain UTEX LB 985" /LENGTH=295 /DNA_ID=CAMNT_0015922515 /DNA_START=96 /DNA_END=983 /DNA_ORIENTATION=+